MAKGYFIREHDKTTCGGKVLEADTNVMMFGIAHARVGDRVSCGKDNRTYVIEGGVSYIESNGRLVAGSLDSYSSCPCKAELIPSFFTGTYESSRSAAPHAMRTATPQATSVTSHPAPRSSGFAPAPNPPSSMLGNSAQVAEPGFYIVPKSTTREQLEASLFTLRDPAVMGKFKLLNPNQRDVKAGSMIVLGDPSNHQCTRQEALLMEVAARTNQILEALNPEEADFMVQHRDAIQTILGFGSNAIGIGASIFKNNLDNVGNALRDIEVLQQQTLQRDGHLRSPTFFAERQRLLAQLNSHMTALTRKGIGFPDHINLKKMLGISSQSLVHHWTNASPGGQIPGYATHLEGVAKASKYVQYGGWVGTAVGGGVSAMKVQDVCTAGNTQACERVRFTEAGSFAGGIMGGAVVGATLSVETTGRFCIALGAPNGGFGTGICTAVAVATGALVGGAAGSGFGEWIGDVIYEATR
ncbi:PAAR domain-containing protein [Pseudomonas moorei]|uniref:PAAR motif-containing protein n=1 Tax=Pseudomonas moorei TaxID=395599 RepID=A0A1H1J8G3_9PSED|nr:PAAR domain-containing protein [Pseudomonas moorei]KAB0505731.1 PAAR domain-containing protein [Pseudomonas moorei]SDR46080.1 PAAR motif-containing protein [Pseudomonas moorei]